ncbi:MAG: DUF1501 domain-containing protein [Fimbriimonadaceae bacterium]|nr:DUF1501 domain-containing protein [Fimbriimonadaceae bacterium]QYK56075.1 MAG: DUF1501 domain-containing protein [Fimbriimonadaceae bacterium]
MNDITRRELFRQSGVLAVGLMTPPWLSAIARADLVKAARGGKNPDNVLVVCQLSGGNDGLNTVIPYTESAYYRLRPTLAVKEDAVLKVSAELGFHPSMEGIHQLFKEGKVAVVNGVGYPNPNRSHFKSMDIWHSASPDGRLKNGWLGRYFDLSLAQGPLDSVAGIGLSVEKPMALASEKSSIPCFASLADIQAMVGDLDSERRLRAIQGQAAESGSATRAIQQANTSALDAMADLKLRLNGFATKETYGDDPFGRGFRQISQLVASSPVTRVVYFSAGGFDTHSRQPDSHARLLKNFSDAVLAFQREMEACGRADRVMVMAFSEFGRRSYENGSLGTDHGKAGPMMLIGKNVKGGFHGQKPDLVNLDDGDLAFSTDFRQVYATALDEWMGSDSGIVLGEHFKPLPVV